MLSPDLAELYGVQPKVLVQAVKRNAARFPEDFMFQLSRDEFGNLKSQFVTSSWGGLRRATPYAFTEQGVAMLSSVLNSPKAIRVNIEIMRAFVRLRRIIASHGDLARKLEELERRYDAQFLAVFDAIRQLMAPTASPKRSIGFKVEETRPVYRTRRQGDEPACKWAGRILLKVMNVATSPSTHAFLVHPLPRVGSCGASPPARPGGCVCALSPGMLRDPRIHAARSRRLSAVARWTLRSKYA
jgi:hypothetical protein